MLFDDDYNTYEEKTPFVTVEAASEQLLTGVLTNIHEFEMGIVLSEYKYLAEHGYEMALSEAEWWDQFKDNVRDLWQNAVRKIKEYFRNFAGWCAEMYDRAMKWLRTIGMTKESASKAISAYNSRTRNSRDESKDRIAKANGVLLKDMNQLVNAMRTFVWDPAKNMGKKGDRYAQAAGSTERGLGIDNHWLVSAVLDDFKVLQFSGRENQSEKIADQVKAKEFEIGKEAAQESYDLLFQSKNVVRSIKQMENDLISRAEKELNSYKISKSSKAPGVFSKANQGAKDEYRSTVEDIKFYIRFVSTAASTAIHIYKSSISTAIMVMRKIFAFNREHDIETDEENLQYRRMANASAIQDNHGLLALYDSMGY